MLTFKVADYMTREVITLRPDTEIMSALVTFVDYKISGAPVTDHTGRLCGIITERDFMRVALHGAYHGEPGGRVDEYMTREVETVRQGNSLVSLAERFLETDFNRFPVVDASGRLVGIISRRDVLRALKTRMRQY